MGNTQSIDHSHGTLLDQIYQFQRHIYDLTRKYYLFGRDRVINEIAKEDPAAVLEVGCGTGRNLFSLEKKVATPHLFGLDASKEMLKQAEKIADSKKSSAAFRFGYAEQFDQVELFKKSSFPVVFFSYSLSMMPTWKEALDKALILLEEDGTLWIVDFWDQGGYPKWFQFALRKWLDLFHVRFEPKLFERLQELEKLGQITLEINPIGRQYAYMAKIKRKDA